MLDSNVLVALLVDTHQHHPASMEMLERYPELRFAVAAHSFAEAYSTVTRQSERIGFGFPPETAWAAIESFRAGTNLVGLTPPQSFDAIRDYARRGGMGPRVYDRLIGEAAIAHAIPAIVTWNVGHMRDLFPGLRIATPEEFA